MRPLPLLLIVSFAACSACGKQEKTVPDTSIAMIQQPVKQPDAIPPLPEPDEPVTDPDQPPPAPDNPFGEDQNPLPAAAALANEIRQANGLRELRLDPKLSAVAQKHADDMKKRGFFDHVNPDKEGPSERMKKARLQFRAFAENIATGVKDPKEVFRGWLESPGHKVNLLNKAYSRHGLGYRDGLWVHLLAD